jgi:hypothetical protein
MKEEKNEILEKTFKIVQGFLKNPPLIVWGSGATVPFRIPSMGALNERLKKEISDFDTENDNLEIELGKEKYQEKMPVIKYVIWNAINEADKLVLEKLTNNQTTDFHGIKLLIDKFIEVHPQVLNIVTTNYDRVLEYAMSYHDVMFTDGFNGKILSSFNENLFQSKNIVNLIKVHGSLNWFNIDGEIRYVTSCLEKYTPQIIAPGKSKYQEAYNSPYRELIQKADNFIKTASSFLVVGFGFNDEHLTPRIKTQIKKGVPLVLITKKITETTMAELKGAEKYILFEEKSASLTNVIYKSSNSENEQSIVLEGDFWQLSKFMEIL